eukprot:5393166-Pleurochrysis_carterae.AAC.1
MPNPAAPEVLSRTESWRPPAGPQKTAGLQAALAAARPPGAPAATSWLAKGAAAVLSASAAW